MKKRTIFGFIALVIAIVGMLTSCAPSTIERHVKAKQYTFAKKCSKGICEAYGAGKIGRASSPYNVGHYVRR